MWRLPSLLGRVLHRFSSANVANSVHAAPSPHAEAEALNSSTLLPFGSSTRNNSFHSSNSQNGQNGSGRRQERTYRPFSRQLPHCSVLDAFGWGAVAAAFLHLSKHITCRDSAPNTRKREGCSWPSYLDSLLASLLRHHSYSPQRYVLPNETKRLFFGVHQAVGPERSFDVSNGSLSSEASDSSGQDSISSEEEGTNSSSNSSISISGSEPEDTWAEVRPNVSLEAAASKLQNVSESSVAEVLNIIGIGSARESGDYSTAFFCFHTAASRGYSKAQYNTGVCYERGHGVSKDIEKAAVYYHLAASNGHRLAQYRYARYLLEHKAGVKAAEKQRALDLMEQAAEAGLKEAQAYLGVFYTKDAHLDPLKAVQYLQQAAANGDTQSLFHLGVCYESGFGVSISLPEAVKHYEKAAFAGHRAAREMLKAIYKQQLEDMVHRRAHRLKTVSSCPCFSSLSGVSMQLPDPEIIMPEIIMPNLTLGTSPPTRSSILHISHSQSSGNLRSLADNLPAQTAGGLSLVYLGPSPLCSPRTIGVG